MDFARTDIDRLARADDESRKNRIDRIKQTLGSQSGKMGWPERIVFATVAFLLGFLSLAVGAKGIIELGFPLTKALGFSAFMLLLGVFVLALLWLVIKIDPLAKYSSNARSSILWRLVQSVPASATFLVVIAGLTAINAFGFPLRECLSGLGLDVVYLLNPYHLGIPVVLAGIFGGGGWLSYRKGGKQAG